MITVSHTQKPSKKQAFELVARLKEGEILAAHEIDSLYNYFSSTTAKRAKTNLEWVAKAAPARNKRDRNWRRPWLNYVHVRFGLAYASDGYRAHCARVFDVPDGTYDPVTLAVLAEPPTGSKDAPDKIESIIPGEKARRDWVVVHIESTQVLDAHNIKSTFCACIADRVYVPADQLNQAANGKPVDLQVSDKDPRVVYGRSEFGVFAIMRVPS